jgi:hypothetical protein
MQSTRVASNHSCQVELLHLPKNAVVHAWHVEYLEYNVLLGGIQSQCVWETIQKTNSLLNVYRVQLELTPNPGAAMISLDAFLTSQSHYAIT